MNYNKIHTSTLWNDHQLVQHSAEKLDSQSAVVSSAHELYFLLESTGDMLLVFHSSMAIFSSPGEDIIINVLMSLIVIFLITDHKTSWNGVYILEYVD